MHSRNLNIWLLLCFSLLLLQMYFSTGTLSAYAATLDKPALYKGYYVNYDWPQYVANYHFILGHSPSEWSFGAVLRRELLYIIGFPFFKLFGFIAGSAITILLSIFVSLFFFFRFIEKEFGVFSAKIAMILFCTYTGIMYWIGSPFVHNLIVPLCLWIYILLYKMQKGSLKFNIIALFIIGILFTGYDLLPLFAPGIILFILFNKNLDFRYRMVLSIVSLVAFVLPQLLVHQWIIWRGGNFNASNEESYLIIIKAYANIFNQLPQWWNRVKLVPETLFNCFFHSNFFVLPFLFLICWSVGRLYFKFKLNLVERCLLISVLLLFLFNNMATPYEGEWQMWGDWLARLYQAVFIVYIMYIIRFAAFVYTLNRMKIIFSLCITIGVVMNLVINLGGIWASPLTSYIYYCYYKHGSPGCYTLNIKYYGMRPLGFPVHYATEIK